MKELLIEIVRSLVDNKEQVSVTEITGSTSQILTISVAKSDLGSVIGKQGRTIRAIRTIVMAAAVKYGKRVVIEVAE